MKTLKFTLSLALTVMAFASFAHAQSATTLDDVSVACHEITLKNGDINSTLGGVRPTGIMPSVHPQVVVTIGQLNGLVTTAESGLATTSDPALVPFRGQLNTAMGDLNISSSYLCYCIVTGDIGAAMGTVAVVRDDFQDLRLIAIDIRGEIQKGKGKGAH
jgi:hypothetical protein